MKIIIFAGGSGKRFWPASRIKNPKQFQNIYGNKPIVRIAYEQLITGFKSSDILFSTGNIYKREIKSIFPEIPEENFIFEPEMRDTGPAITLAVSYVHQKFPDEIIAVRWSDQLVKDVKTSVQSLKEAEIQAQSGKIVLIAVPPRYPSPHMGYIKFSKRIKQINNPKIMLFEFLKFVEKPTVETAKKYISSGRFAWNPGYWVFKPEQYLGIIKKTNNEIYTVCQKIVESNFNPVELKKFKNLEKIAADYIFAEKINPKEAVVIRVDMGWSDVGAWISLKEALEKTRLDVVTKGNVYAYQSTDSIIYNYENNKLIAAIGLDGFVVVNTADAIAIFPKKDNSKLKDLLKLFEKTKYSKYL